MRMTSIATEKIPMSITITKYSTVWANIKDLSDGGNGNKSVSLAVFW